MLKGVSFGAPFFILRNRVGPMIHLISIEGKSARKFYLEPDKAANLQTVIRGMNAGRSLLISTRFRSDLFFHAEEAVHQAIMKLWAMHAQCESNDVDRLTPVFCSGNEAVLDHFFQDMNRLSNHRYKYRRYQKTLSLARENEPHNPILKMLTDCDQHLTSLELIRRRPLIETPARLKAKEIQDTFAWSMSLIRGKLSQN